MRRPSWLDVMLEGFQHNWETRPQFRAMISGVAGILVIVMLCGVMGVATSFASSVANTFAGSGSQNYVVNVTTGATPTTVAFPLTTLSPWPSPVIPDGQPLGASSTPQPTATPAPTATDMPTPTPCQTNCGGGPPDNITVSISPATFTNNTVITVYVTTTYPNEGFNVFVTWPNGATSPTNIGSENGTSGSVNIGAVPGGCGLTPKNNLSLWVKTPNNPGGITALFPC